MPDWGYELLKQYLQCSDEDIEHYEHTGFGEIIATLRDGRKISFNEYTKILRGLPSDPNNMTEQQCRNVFGNRLEWIMARRGMTQDELSRRTGITQAMISRYVRGKSSPSLYAIDKLAKVLQCSVDDFRYTG